MNLTFAKNIEFEGYSYCEDYGRDLPLFSLQDRSAAEWNDQARINNTKVFFEHFGRQPENYEEVLNWMDSLFGNKEIPSAGNTEDHSSKG